MTAKVISASARQQLRRHPQGWRLLFTAAILGLPLLIALAWGASFDDSTLGIYLAAQQFARQGMTAAGLATLSPSPLIIALFSFSPAGNLTTGLVLGALGWSAIAATLYLVMRRLDQATAAVLAALLVASSPLAIVGAGSPVAWAVALAWAILGLSLTPVTGRGTLIRTGLLVLLFAIQLDASTLTFAIALTIAVRLSARRGSLPLLAVTILGVVWQLFAVRQGAAPFAGSAPYSWHALATLMQGYEQLWLFAPFVIGGLVEVISGRNRWAGLRGPLPILLVIVAWTLVAVLGGGVTGLVTAAVVAYALAALGVAGIVRRLSEREEAFLSSPGAPAAMLAILVAPLLLVQLWTLNQLFGSRPDGLAALQSQAAQWLRENSELEASVYGAPFVGVLARRPTLPASLDSRFQVRPSAAGSAPTYADLLAAEPDYIVSEQNVAWDSVTRSGWFRERYLPLAFFEDDYVTDAPLTVWGRAVAPFDGLEAQAQQATAGDRLALIGFELGSPLVTPGETIDLNLHLQALAPVENGFITGLHMVAPDGWIWAYQEELTPRALPGDWWQSGQVITERFQLTAPADLPSGAYRLQLFWRAADEDAHWPVLREGDDGVFDRVELASVIAPPPVWRGASTEIQARFEDDVSLQGVAVPSDPQAGDQLEVTLIWEGLGRTTEDYTAFVHLVDQDNEIIAAHDGMPLENRFPTSAFRPGIPVADTHRLPLPADLPPGDYQLRTGLYLLETGQRLPVQDAQGITQADGVLPLLNIAIGR